MEWFSNRFSGKSDRTKTSVFVRSRSAARPVLTEIPQPVTRTERQRRRTTTKTAQEFAGFNSPPGKF